ncbi:MAG: hypothetical protein LBF72_04060 [Holosporales bacterium]|jgi:hypothetical protein|nr:hypothetical protein [Holosporales bacterium]
MKKVFLGCVTLLSVLPQLAVSADSSAIQCFTPNAVVGCLREGFLEIPCPSCRPFVTVSNAIHNIDNTNPSYDSLKELHKDLAFKVISEILNALGGGNVTPPVIKQALKTIAALQDFALGEVSSGTTRTQAPSPTPAPSQERTPAPTPAPAPSQERTRTWTQEQTGTAWTWTQEQAWAQTSTLEPTPAPAQNDVKYAETNMTTEAAVARENDGNCTEAAETKQP